jgi:hypothetical protein
MVKTGLIHKALARLELNWETYQLTANSKEVKAHNAGLQETCSILKEVAISMIHFVNFLKATTRA